VSVRVPPKVSICIPSHNYGRFLPKAIDSALSQSYPYIEVIIVDDGSTDDSLEIAESYATKEPSRVRVYTNPGRRNLGVSATINLAFQKSSGEYWSIMGADDILYPQKTTQQVDYLENHKNICWVYSHAHSVDQRGNLRREVWGQDLTAYREPLESLIAANRIPAMTVLARRKCIESVGLHVENLLYSDWEFWVRLAADHPLSFIKKALVQYRVHGQNMSLGVEDGLDLKRALDVMDSLRMNASHYGPPFTLSRTLALIDLQRARYLFHLAQDEKAAQALALVFELYPSLQDKPRLFLRWVTDVYLANLNPEGFHSWVLSQLPANTKASFKKQLTNSFKAQELAREAVASYQNGNIQKVRQTALQAQLADPFLILDKQLMSVFGKAIAGSHVLNKAKQLKRKWLQ
jgi:alpha-1,3-rhamnosyltransferase